MLVLELTAPVLLTHMAAPVKIFFHDRNALAVLAQEVIPQLFASAKTSGRIRVWVPGCATGEEAYTVGILLLEQAARSEWRPEMQIFGSDIDSGALATCREGRYPLGIEANLSQARLRHYFQRQGAHYRVRRELRDIIVFASHSVLRDPPFSRLDLVWCSDLATDLDPERRHQLCVTFHYALHRGGYLFLGPSEEASPPQGLFRTIDPQARIYQATAQSEVTHPTLPSLLRPPSVPSAGIAAARARSGSHAADATLHMQALEKVAPPSMLVGEYFQVIHLSESAGRFLRFSGGPISANAIDMVGEELRADLRAALQRAFVQGESTLSMPLTVQLDDAKHRLHLQVKPVTRETEPQRCALVFFIEGDALPEVRHRNDRDRPAAQGSGETARQLQEALDLTHGRLRASQEESEIASEELRAVNAELQSINEEYRSTSEELETSREELQSINEELQTVNQELKLKLESVSRAHSDLQNLMAATDFGILFLDRQLCIKRFTPRLTKLFNITPKDEGRPITDLTHQLDYDQLADHARSVLTTLVPIELEVQSRAGGWYLVRVRPYQTIDDKIDGVVATFVDITERKRAEDKLQHSELRLQTLIEGIPQLVWRAVDGGNWTWASTQWTSYTGQSEPQSRGWGWLEPLHPHDRDAARQAWSQATERGGFEVEYRVLGRAERGYRWFQTRATPVRDDAGKIVEWLGTSTDVHDLRTLQEHQRLLVAELQHRTRNLMSVVHAMTDRTVESSKDLDDFRARFRDRLDALARVQGLLSRLNDSGRVVFDELIESELAAMHGTADRVDLVGPRGIRLRSSTVQTLALAIHELATNAVKYGALGQPAARLSICWRLAAPDNQGRPKLHIEWRESAVAMPPVDVSSQRAGHGRELIEQALPYQIEAETNFELAADGVRCTIVIPVSASNVSPRLER